jgi:glycerate kinase
MKIVIAPDSYKESLSAARAAEALAAGAVAAAPEASIDVCPIADGGEGTVEAMVAATAGRFISADVFDPLGAPIRGRFGMLGQGGGAGLPGEVGLSGAVGLSEGADWPTRTSGTAVIEIAAASGLALVPADKRDPTRTTTFGTGQLILAALDAGARSIVVGIGGSATVDGGCGAAQALGVKFLDADGSELIQGLAGGGLGEIARIDTSGADPRLAEARLTVACDVTNPLTGPEGAARVFGPQKGATPEVAGQLDANLAHLAEVIRQDLGINVASLQGAGAAGGLGAGLVAFCGATLEDGFAIVARTVGLSARLAGADLCITGEGSFDSQSAAGKAAVGVAKLCRISGVPVICVPGRATADAPHELFAAVWPLVGGDVTQQQAMREPAAVLARRAADAVRNFIAKRGLH